MSIEPEPLVFDFTAPAIPAIPTPAPHVEASSTVAEARVWLQAHLEEGVHCPVCTQHAKVYYRKVTSTSARSLIALYRACVVGWGHFPTIIGRKQADEAKMVHFGLIEEERTLRPDGGRAGWWRVTPLGAQWIHGEATVPKYAAIFDSHCRGLVGEQVSISDALGEPFDFAELMALRAEDLAS